MKLLSPKSLPLPESECKFYHKLYRAMLKLLLYGYKRKVIIDRIILGEGAELLHCVRDEWFEKQLIRFRIAYFPPIRVVSFSATHELRSGVFNWKDTMTLLRPQRLTQAKTEPAKRPMKAKPVAKQETKLEVKPAPKSEAKQKPQQEEKRSKIRFNDGELKPPRFKKQKELVITRDEYTHHLGFDENDIF